MKQLLLQLYDIFFSHKIARRLSLLTFTFLFIVIACMLNFKEDISDFLPMDERRKEAMEVYGEVAGSNKIIVTIAHEASLRAATDSSFTPADSTLDNITEAVEQFVSDTKNFDGNPLSYRYNIDIDKIATTMDFVISHAPYLLTDTDWIRIDSIVTNDSIITERMLAARQNLMLPMGPIMTQTIASDPLSLFSPLLSHINPNSEMTVETYDSYIFTPDLSRAIIVIESPFGASESANNDRLIDYLYHKADEVMKQHPNIDIHLTGAPVIAVGNARQIKYDSILTVAISMALILLILFTAFRDTKNLVLIALSVAWGFLFALAGLSLIHGSSSVIIIGISSIIIGIAVNYPLHYIAHLSHSGSPRAALSEIVTPLAVGNITTVGAFLTLTPLQSTALRDLGIFCALLLIGTIVFVILYLPHLARKPEQVRHSIFDRIGEYRIEDNRWLPWLILCLTPVFGFFSLQTEFDSDLANINFMTKEQRSDMDYFSSVIKQESGKETIYAVYTAETMDSALRIAESHSDIIHKIGADGNNVTRCLPILCSSKEQTLRLQRWNMFVENHGKHLIQTVALHGEKLGFGTEAFEPFYQIIQSEYTPLPLSDFAPLTDEILAQHLISNPEKHRSQVVDIIKVEKSNTDKIESQLRDEGIFSFNMNNLNRTITTNLSSEFNYIGWACSIIVFLFLWLSFRSLKLALISFIPMAISWIWILGIMALFGIKFNIVNVILATFIFGQGDDYTIFMTEGAIYEHRERKPILASYRSSIIISALIMFIGIGSLIIARHPAMHSLAEVTIIGMISVVLMANVFPPLLYRWMVKRNWIK